MKVTFLGTGTSQGVPFIGCTCSVCLSDDPKDNRLRSSLLIQSATTNVVIDTGPDFRQQMLKSGINKLDAIIFTHAHKDHVAGLDDIKAFNYHQLQPMDVYANMHTQNAIKKEFSYIFDKNDYPGIPKVNLHEINNFTPFVIGDIHFLPIEVMHYHLPVLGFRFNDFTYITDANYISDEEKEKIKGTKYLVLNALRNEPHLSHFTLNQAIELSSELKPHQTYFTHISHQLGNHDLVLSKLPKNIFLAHDMLSITF